jgi:hypothetical protein
VGCLVGGGGRRDEQQLRCGRAGAARAATYSRMCGALSKCGTRVSGATRLATSASQRRAASITPRRIESVAPFSRTPHKMVGQVK